MHVVNGLVATISMTVLHEAFYVFLTKGQGACLFCLCFICFKLLRDIKKKSNEAYANELPLSLCDVSC